MREGQKYGFDSLSPLSQLKPSRRWPPLHTHESEEAEILLEGRASYVIEEKRFTVDDSYVAKVSAGLLHTLSMPALKSSGCSLYFQIKTCVQRVGQEPIGENQVIFSPC